MVKSGIYRINISRDGKESKHYIGQSVNLGSRFKGHIASLRRGKHKNNHLQRVFDQYGEGAFSFEVVLLCAPVCEILNLYEKSVLDLDLSRYGADRICNIRRECINSRLGLLTPPETRARQSAAALGRKASEETRARISAGKKGQGPSQEHMNRLAEMAKGRPMPEHVRLALLASRVGKKKSPEEIARRQATRAANKASKLAAQEG